MFLSQFKMLLNPLTVQWYTVGDKRVSLVFKALVSCTVTFQFFTLCNVVLTFESVDEILKCDHSNESYRAVLSCGAIYHAVQGGCTF